MNFSNSKKNKILFFTGTRADYGLLSSLIRLFVNDLNYETKILASGTHLVERFGNSLNEIIGDGFPVDFKVDIDLATDSDLDISKSAGIAVGRYAEVLNLFRPDLAIVLGDRYEALSFAMSCQIMKVPLAHLHGGEITEGAIDNSFRHCITKLSVLHFASAEIHRHRIIQMGESAECVYNVGALGVDNVISLKKKSKQELTDQLKIQFKSKNFMVTFHPETLGAQSSEFQMEQLLSALQKYMDQNSDSYFIFTMPNSDPGHQKIADLMNKFILKNQKQTIAFSTMGRLNYLSALTYCSAVIGNSSSGLIEAPVFGIPTLNIGDRQKGRLRGDSIIDVATSEQNILAGMSKIVHFIDSKQTTTSVYGDGQAAVQIKKIIDEKIQNPISIRKTFYDRD
jgi:GDP/UDP-N,N'-diacetylbacillosamine 2-epimerase (hydrolysing)